MVVKKGVSKEEYFEKLGETMLGGDKLVVSDNEDGSITYELYGGGENLLNKYNDTTEELICYQVLMRCMIKIGNVPKEEVLKALTDGVEYKQRGNDTFVWYYSKKIMREDVGNKFQGNLTIYNGWENEGFETFNI